MKIEEIKLSLERNIQFALADDLKSAVDYLNAATAGINKSIANYETSYKAMQSEANGGKSVVSTQMKLINLVEAKAKELGISANSIPSYNEANKAFQTANNAIDKVNEF